MNLGYLFQQRKSSTQMTETVSDTDMNDCLSPSQEREYTLILGETASISGEKKKVT